jgi:pimeloyl-ACP methyl ester carboxylesterase
VTPRRDPDATVRLDGDGLAITADIYEPPTGAGPPVLLMHGGGQTRHAWGGAGGVFADAGYRAVSVDLRGHSDSDWSPDGDYALERFAADIIAIARSFAQPPALVGASLGGIASLLALEATVGESPLASCLVLVDVAPRIEEDGRIRIQEFMRSGMRGFDALDDAADAIASYNPHRPRPRDLSGLRKNLRERGDRRWYWHWDPRFIRHRSGIDGQSGIVHHHQLQTAARAVTIPTLLVRGRMSDIVSDESVRELLELIPHAEVVDVADAGHMVAGDRNDAFNDGAVGFVARHLAVGAE